MCEHRRVFLLCRLPRNAATSIWCLLQPRCRTWGHADQWSCLWPDGVVLRPGTSSCSWSGATTAAARWSGLQHQRVAWVLQCVGNFTLVASG